VIITQTPLRISFAGGGTDLAAYYAQREGYVVSTAIDKFVYVIVKERFDDAIYLNTMKKEIRASVDEIEHELCREAMRLAGVERGVEVTLLSDIPSEGAGLGSSSSFTVGLLNAFHMYRGEQITAEQLAQEACRIEIDVLGKPIGKQDQYIAAYGGLRSFSFRRDDTVEVRRLALGAKQLRELDARLHLFFTGRTRKADVILSEQKQKTSDRSAELDGIKELAGSVAPALERGDYDRLGEILHRNWQLKQKLASGISDSSLDAMYELALAHGALGGKICGAGGGGFLLVYCPVERQERLEKGMRDYRAMPFRLEPDGSKVIFNYRRDTWK
jgi:D-glycero-alpha-D-manno-heptose-7-phosphate kinase